MLYVRSLFWSWLSVWRYDCFVVMALYWQLRCCGLNSRLSMLLSCSDWANCSHTCTSVRMTVNKQYNFSASWRTVVLHICIWEANCGSSICPVHVTDLLLHPHMGSMAYDWDINTPRSCEEACITPVSV